MFINLNYNTKNIKNVFSLLMSCFTVGYMHIMLIFTNNQIRQHNIIVYNFFYDQRLYSEKWQCIVTKLQRSITIAM